MRLLGHQRHLARLRCLHLSTHAWAPPSVPSLAPRTTCRAPPERAALGTARAPLLRLPDGLGGRREAPPCARLRAHAPPLPLRGKRQNAASPRRQGFGRPAAGAGSSRQQRPSRHSEPWTSPWGPLAPAPDCSGGGRKGAAAAGDGGGGGHRGSDFPAVRGRHCPCPLSRSLGPSSGPLRWRPQLSTEV